MLLELTANSRILPLLLLLLLCSNNENVNDDNNFNNLYEMGGCVCMCVCVSFSVRSYLQHNLIYLVKDHKHLPGHLLH